MVEIADFLNERNMSQEYRIRYNVLMKASASDRVMLVRAREITRAFAGQGGMSKERIERSANTAGDCASNQLSYHGCRASGRVMLVQAREITQAFAGQRGMSNQLLHQWWGQI